MNKYDVSFKSDTQKTAKKNRYVEAETEEAAVAMARQELGIDDDRLVASAQNLGAVTDTEADAEVAGPSVNTPTVTSKTMAAKPEATTRQAKGKGRKD